MARIRTIKPEFWEDEKLSALPLEVNLLFIALWNFADDEGVVKSNSVWIKSKVFPLRDEIRKTQIEQWIGQLQKARFLVPFSFSGIGYYVIRTFKTHQVINHPVASKIPKSVINKALESFTDDSLNIPVTLPDDSLNIPRVIPDDYSSERKGMEKERKGKEPPNEIILLNEFSKQFFDEKYINDKSFDCFEKLIRIDKYSIEEIKKAIIAAQSDPFWQKNFLSPLKLRNTDKNDVKYIDTFLCLAKNENRKNFSNKGNIINVKDRSAQDIK